MFEESSKNKEEKKEERGKKGKKEKRERRLIQEASHPEERGLKK